MSKETFDTLGNQKKTNYALRADMTKEEFIKEVTTGLTPPPAYFPENVMMNIRGYESIDKVLERGHQALSPEAFEAAANETGAIVLDVRDPQDFAKGFVPNAINIGLNGQFAPWVGALITDLKQEILIIAPEGKEEETVTRLARVGYDHCIGYLKGGYAAWKASSKDTDRIESISAEEFGKRLNSGTINVLDVRRQSEYESEHLVDVPNLPLDYINQNMSEIDKNTEYHIHCAGGYRSMIFASILKARGFDKVIDVAGGFGAIKKVEGIKKTSFVCPANLPQ
jgi:rhodanese-related sulfurtransferase